MTRRATPNREKVFTAAALEFADHGYRGTSYGSIAERAGLQRNIVQNYAPYKTILAQTIVDKVYVGGAFYASVRHPDLTGINQLLLSSHLVAHKEATDVFARAADRLLNERSEIDADLPKPYVGWIELVTEDIQVMIAAGELPSDTHSDKVAQCLVASYLGMRQLKDTVGTLEDFEDQVVWAEYRLIRGFGYTGPITDPVRHVRSLVAEFNV